MKQRESLLLASLASSLPAISAQTSVIAVGPNGSTCPPALETITYVTPAVYSSVFESAGTIFNFMGGTNSLVVNNVPTTVITTSYITSTVVQTVSAVAIGSGGSVAPSTTSNTFFTGPTNPTSFSQVPPPTTSSAPVLTYTTVGPSGQTTTVTTAQPTPTLGQGVASGTVTDIPQTSPILLAFSYDFQPAKVKRHVDRRLMKRQSSSQDMVADGYVDGDSKQGATTNNCGYAGRYYLTQGQLLGVEGGRVGRNITDTYAVFAASNSDHEIVTFFTFVDGILRWNSPDAGPATFYQCGSGVPAPLFAGFPEPPFSNCTSVEIGAVAAADCPIDLTSPAQQQTTPNVMSTVTGTPPSQSTSLSSTQRATSQSEFGPSMSSSTGTPITQSSSATSASLMSSGTSGSQSTSVSSSQSLSSASPTSTGNGGRPSTGISSSTRSSVTISTTQPSGTLSSLIPMSTSLCPASNGTTVNGYAISCGRGVDGQNIDSGVQVASLELCVNLCEATPQCVSVSFNHVSQFCYKHSTLPTESSDQPDFDSAVQVDSISATVSSSATTSQGGAGSSTNGQGSDTSTSSRSSAVSSFTSPASASSTTSLTRVSSSVSPGSTTSPAAPSSSSSTGLCPSQNDMVVNGYHILCGRGGFGTNIAGTGQTAASFDECISRCTGVNNCVGVSYETDVPNGACYLYSTFTGPNNGQTQYDTAVLESVYNPGSTSTLTSTSVSSSNTGIGSSSISIIQSSGGGLSTSSVSSTLTSTTTTSTAQSSTFSASSGFVSSTITSSSPSATASGFCPSEDNQVVKGYHILCRKGGTGININPSPSATSFEDCIQHCSNTAGCVGASYQNDVANGACYLYSSFDGPSGQTGYDTAVLERVYNPSSGASTMTTMSTTINVGTTTGSSSSGGGLTLPTTQIPLTTSTATTTSSAPSASVSDICPAADGQNFDGYHVYCNNGGVGDNIIGARSATSLQDCIQQCSQTANCVGATHEHTPGDACYLYSAFTGLNSAQTTYDTAVLPSVYPLVSTSSSSGILTTSPILPVSSTTAPASITSTTQAQPISSTTSATTTAIADPARSPCPVADGSTYQNFQVYCNGPVDGASNSGQYPNGQQNVLTFQDCLKTCQQLNSDGYGCTSVAYDVNGHICYPHEGAVTDKPVNPAYVGAVYTGPAPIPRSSSTTTTTDAAAPTYTDAPCQANASGDDDFVIKCGRAITGTNINPGGEPIEATFDECINECRLNDACVSVSYANNNDGHCYLHSEDQSYNLDRGYHSAVKIGKGSPLENQP